MLFANRYLSLPALTCFDGDPDAEAAAAEAAAAEAAAAANKTFTQEQVNKMLAEDKRKHKLQLEKTEKQLNEILESKNLSETERSKAEEAREDILKQLRTREEQAREDKKKLAGEYEIRLTAAEKRAVEAEKKYEESTIARSLQDAAVANDAFNPSILVTYLRGDAKLDAVGNPMIKVTVTKEDGTTEEGLMTPMDAVARMKNDPDHFGGMFKSNIVSGVGGNSGGPNGGKNGKVNVKKLSTEEYMRLRKEDPSKLGL